VDNDAWSHLRHGLAKRVSIEDIDNDRLDTHRTQGWRLLA
jgi:hypothetical protein